MINLSIKKKVDSYFDNGKMYLLLGLIKQGILTR